jgi:hypothetical protein
MLSKFLSVQEVNNEKGELNYTLKEIYINKNQIVLIQDDERLEKRYRPEDGKNQKFTKISLNTGNMGYDVTVVGDVKLIYKKIEAKDDN